MNWTKEKIVKMAEITGLSQSQVYKWCWDQKKKQNKGREDYSGRGHFDRRKLIRKNLGYRHLVIQEEDEQDEKSVEGRKNSLELRREEQTKVKKMGVFGELEMGT